MDSTELSIKFNVGDIVVYPTQGVGVIQCLEIRKDREYFRIRLTESDMDVLLPSDHASNLGLRHLASKNEVYKALQSLSKEIKASSTDWKTRLLENQQLLKEGTLESIAQIVNSLYRRSKVKQVPALERKLYDSALSMLVDESSSVLGIGREDTRKEIFLKLEY